MWSCSFLVCSEQVLDTHTSPANRQKTENALCCAVEDYPRLLFILCLSRSVTHSAVWGVQLTAYKFTMNIIIIKEHTCVTVLLTVCLLMFVLNLSNLNNLVIYPGFLQDGVRSSSQQVNDKWASICRVFEMNCTVHFHSGILWNQVISFNLVHVNV